MIGARGHLHQDQGRQHDSTTWMDTGEAVTWAGVRSPEAVDTKQYALIRAN